MSNEIGISLIKRQKDNILSISSQGEKFDILSPIEKLLRDCGKWCSRLKIVTIKYDQQLFKFASEF
jgi:hypothetical protein